MVCGKIGGPLRCLMAFIDSNQTPQLPFTLCAQAFRREAGSAEAAIVKWYCSVLFCRCISTGVYFLFFFCSRVADQCRQRASVVFPRPKLKLLNFKMFLNNCSICRQVREYLKDTKTVTCDVLHSGQFVKIMLMKHAFVSLPRENPAGK